jgi:hypothetical protein
MSNDSSKFDPKANFIDSEVTYNFKNSKHTTPEEKDNFWIERFNFFKPSGEHGYKGVDITSIDENQKNALFNYIIELYDYQTGSSLSSVLFYSEKDTTLYMWKKYGETEKVYAARNIITNKMPKEGDSNSDISIVGIYYSDSNYNIYMGRKKNYTNIKSYENGILTWNWRDTNTKDGRPDEGSDQFELNTNFKYTYTINTDSDSEDSDEEQITEVGVIKVKKSYDIIKQIEVIFNRLPKTFKKSNTAFRTLYNDSKVIMRVNNLLNPIQSLDNTVTNTTQIDNSVGGKSLINKNVLQQSLLRANKIAARSSVDVKAVKTASINQIEPKIQATYGFADFGKIENLNVDGSLSMDDGSYITTHKIGYEELDRYRLGPMSCDSYLF